MSKRIFCALGIALLLFSGSIFGFEITPTTRIVIGEKAAKGEQSAANAMAADLKKISEGKFEVITAAGYQAGKNDIIFGTPASNPQIKANEALFKIPADKVDAISIVEKGGNLYIAGYDVPAAVSALFTFLTDHIGFRYFWPGEDGIYPPEKPQLKFSGLSFHSAPDFYRRTYALCGTGGLSLSSLAKPWLIRNRVSTLGNVTYFKNTVKEGVDLGGRLMNSGHSLCIEMKRPELIKFCAENPDMFLLAGDKRVHQVPCWTSDEAAKIIAGQFAAFSNEMGPTFFEMSAPDYSAQLCQCERCKKRNFPDMSSAFHEFLTKVINYTKELSKEQNTYGTLAYSTYANYPKEGKIAPVDEATLYCNYDRCYKHLFNDSKCPANRMFPRERLQEWLDHKVKMGIYGYEYDAFGIGEKAPTVRYRMLRDQFRKFKKYNIASYHTETTEWQKYDPAKPMDQNSDWCTNRLNYYITARLLWNTEEEPLALIDDWCKRVFGPAAKPMYDYYLLLDQIWTDTPAHCGYVFNPLKPLAADIWTEKTINQAQKLLADAAKAVAGNSKALRQVEIEQAMFKEWEEGYKLGIQLRSSGSLEVQLQDGDTPDWSKAWKLPAFKPLKEEDKKRPAGIDCRIAANGKNLYLKFKFNENPADLKTIATQANDPAVYSDDCVEIFLEPPTTVPGEYYHLVFNVNGVKYAAKGLGGMEFDTSWRDRWEVKTEKNAKDWTAEVVIPFGQYPGTLSPVEKEWKLGIVRSATSSKVLPISGWPSAQYHSLTALGTFKVVTPAEFKQQKRMLFFGGGIEHSDAQGLLFQLAAKGWKIDIPPTEAEFTELLDNNYSIIFITGARGAKKELITSRGRFFDEEHAKLKKAIENGALVYWSHSHQNPAKWLKDEDYFLKGAYVKADTFPHEYVDPGAWGKTPNDLSDRWRQHFPTYGYETKTMGKKFTALVKTDVNGVEMSYLLSAPLGKGYLIVGSAGMSMYGGFGVFGGKNPLDSVRLLENLTANFKKN